MSTISHHGFSLSTSVKRGREKIFSFTAPIVTSQRASHLITGLASSITCERARGVRARQYRPPSTIQWPVRILPDRLRMTSEPNTENPIVVVPLPEEKDILSPGSVGQVSLHKSVLRHLISKGSQTIAVIPSQLLTVPNSNAALLMLTNAEQPAAGSDYVIADCWSTTRVRLTDVSQLGTNKYFTTAHQTEFHDTVVQTHEERVTLAEAEWQIWLAHLETTRLARRLEKLQSSFPQAPDAQKVQVFAPKHYDKKILTAEWDQTPFITRRIWCHRAENFSFAVLRCMRANQDEMRRAMGCDLTVDRLLIAADCIQREQARIYAQLSLKDALG